MADFKDARIPSPGGGIVERALRAAVADAPGVQAYRDFIAHTQGCGDCRTVGGCDEAAGLKQNWRHAQST